MPTVNPIFLLNLHNLFFLRLGKYMKSPSASTYEIDKNEHSAYYVSVNSIKVPLKHKITMRAHPVYGVERN